MCGDKSTGCSHGLHRGGWGETPHYCWAGVDAEIPFPDLAFSDTTTVGWGKGHLIIAKWGWKFRLPTWTLLCGQGLWFFPLVFCWNRAFIVRKVPIILGCLFPALWQERAGLSCGSFWCVPIGVCGVQAASVHNLSYRGAQRSLGAHHRVILWVLWFLAGLPSFSLSESYVCLYIMSRVFNCT